MKLILLLARPPAPLMHALLERTCELATALPHVEGAHLLERRITPEGQVITRQKWRARAGLPALLAPHFEEGLQEWALSFDRRLGETTVRWHAESAAVQVPGRCHGTLDFQPALGGTGTRLELRFEWPAANPALATIFGALLERHWRALAAAAAAAATTPVSAEPAG